MEVSETKAYSGTMLQRGKMNRLVVAPVTAGVATQIGGLRARVNAA
jgi:hypothetical protein